MGQEKEIESEKTICFDCLRKNLRAKIRRLSKILLLEIVLTLIVTLITGWYFDEEMSFILSLMCMMLVYLTAGYYSGILNTIEQILGKDFLKEKADEEGLDDE
jgi:hypothetical protein